MAKIIGQDTLETVAREIAMQHRPALFNWAAKFGLSARAVLPAPAMQQSARDQVASVAATKPSTHEKAADGALQKPKQKRICHACGRAVTYNVAQFCWFNKLNFGGNIYCMDCQKKV